MDDLSEKLAEILNDPESMNRVRQMAESLLGNQQEPESSTENHNDGNTNLFDFFGNSSNNSNSGGFSMPSGDELKSIMGLLSKFKSTENDSNTQLLVALKPHLSEPRQDKVDTAIKILKIIDMLPLLKESGLLNL